MKLGPMLLFVVLTGFTQVGGLIYLVGRWGSHAAARRFGFGAVGRWLATAAGFCALYLAVSLFVLPPVATALGRPPLPCSTTANKRVVPLNRLVCVLNRHYASPRVHDLLAKLSEHLNAKYPGTVVAYLDANFALVDGFPMPPHLSHDDGDKIDLAFFYQNRQGRYQPASASSPLGYWGFEEPRPGDPAPCAQRSDLATLRWDMAFFKPLLAPLRLDEERTAEMLRWLTDNSVALSLEMMLLEPHLKTRFKLESERVRFQGCRPARHDDHVHIAVRSQS